MSTRTPLTPVASNAMADACMEAIVEDGREGFVIIAYSDMPGAIDNNVTFRGNACVHTLLQVCQNVIDTFVEENGADC